MELVEVVNKVKASLKQLYDRDGILFQRGLCERCIAHRLAVYLEDQRFNDEGYFVDCEYNKALLNGETVLKDVSSPHGNYIDILITKRNSDPNGDLACFEIKKIGKSGQKKDRENLRILTAGVRYGHKIGFFVLLGPTLSKTKLEIYQNGDISQTIEFNDEPIKTSSKIFKSQNAG